MGRTFMVELEGMLDMLDWRFRAGMSRYWLFVDRNVVFAPINEILPEAGIFQFFPELFWLHEIALKFLHNLKHLINDHIPNLPNLDSTKIIFSLNTIIDLNRPPKGV